RPASSATAIDRSLSERCYSDRRRGAKGGRASRVRGHRDRAWSEDDEPSRTSAMRNSIRIILGRFRQKVACLCSITALSPHLSPILLCPLIFVPSSLKKIGLSLRARGH